MRSPPKKLGPTGDHPQGKIHPTDRGGLQLAIVAKDGKVIMAFGADISWVGFDPDHADTIADGLKEAAQRAREWRAR